MTNRTGLTGTLALNLNQNFGFAFSYNNYITFQTAGLKALNDTTKLLQIQQTLVFSPHYTFVGKKMVNNIFLTTSYSRLDDLNQYTSKYLKNSKVNINLGQSLSVTAIAFGFSPSINFLYSITPVVKIFTVGPTVAFSKSFLKNKISTSTSITFVATMLNSIWSSKTITNNIGFSYRVTKNHALKLGNSIMYSMNIANNTSEYKGSITYTYTFDYSVDKDRKQSKSF